MAEATGLRNNALPYPIYAQPFGIVFPLLDADGDPISPSSPDSERSLNGDTFADCTNEATEIATSSGVCFLLLTAAEMTADVTAVRIQSTGAKTTVVTLHPRKLATVRSGTAAGGAAGSITLDSGASAIDDYYNGCVVVGVLDGTTELRMVTDYVGSTKVASVTPNWNTTPDSDDTFTVLMPEGRQVNLADVVAFNGVAATSASGRPEVNTTHAAGTAWNSGGITTGTFASGAINAAAIAADAIGASELAADAVTEIAAGISIPSAASIADAVWDEDATAHQTQGTFGQAIGDPVADTNTIYKATVTDATGATVGVDVAAVLDDTGTSGVVLANDAITAAKIAADAIGASELAADAVAEIAAAVAAPTAAVIADAVWDEDATGHQTQGTFGQAIGDPAADTNTIYKAVVTDATGATVGVDVVAVQADTDNIQTRIPAALVSGRIDASVGAMAAGTVTAAAIATDAIDADAVADGAITSGVFATGAITAGAIAADAIGASELAADAVAEIQSGLATAASIAALNNISTAQVNAEVLDVLNTDTFAEPGQGNPAATTSLVAKIGYLYKAWRNRTTQTSSEYALYADDATTKDQEAVVSDNGTTFERGEVSTGA